MKNHLQVDTASMTPKQALDVLMDGNKRFVNNLSANRDLLQMVLETSKNQFPFAAILSCSDSRVPPELVFDQGLGNIFSVRLAGNIASLKSIASLEFACKYLGSKLVVVMGHTRCGGVLGACDGKNEGNLGAIFAEIQPAVEAETVTLTDRNSSNPQFVSNVTHLNVEQQMRSILSSSTILRDLLAEEKIGIVGAVYDLDTGVVTFYEEDQLFCIDTQFSSIQEHVSNG